MTTERNPVAGEKEAVTPEGRFEAAKVAFTVNHSEAALMVEVAVWPWVTLTDAALLVTEKVGGAFTTKATGTVWLMLPELPMMEMG